MKKLTLLFIIIISLFQNAHAADGDTLSYVFLGHTYYWGFPYRVDPRLEKMDMSKYDRIWLGGDICSEASLKYSTFEYLDSLFDLDKPENHWALGNHDTRNRNYEWNEEFTKRPPYYSYSKDGITTIVMNGNISPLDCENLDKQFQIIKNVCDTMTTGNLIFLIHHGITSGVPGIASPSNYGHSNLNPWIANCYSDSASYIDAIYPMLVALKKKGVNVIHIMGDVGANKKSYHAISDDGIEYFGSGINNSKNILKNTPIIDKDLILVFKHVIATNKLTWEFKELGGF
jgi:hypothetical protein